MGVTKRKRKPVKKFDDSSDDDSDAEFESYKQVKSGSRKVKLYQMPEFKNDPAMEQKRQNAINAKVNRDRKKKEKNALQSQMQVLRNENKSLNKKNKKYRSRLSSLEKRLEIMEAVISSHGLNSALKASGKKGFRLLPHLLHQRTKMPFITEALSKMRKCKQIVRDFERFHEFFGLAVICTVYYL